MGYQNFNQTQMPGLPTGLPGQLPAYGGGNGVLPPQGLPGVSPSQYALLNRQLQNPHAGDGFAPQAGANAGGQPPANPMSELMPDPLSMAAGGAIAWGAAKGLDKLEERGKINGLVEKIDRAPGIRHVSDWMGKNVIDKYAGKWDWSKELFLQEAKGINADPKLKWMQERQLDISRKAFEGMDNPHVRDGLATLAGKNTFADFKNAIETDWQELDVKAMKQNGASKDAIKAAKKANQVRHGLLQQVKGLEQHHLPYVQGKAQIIADLDKRGVGPIGRTIATSIYGFKRIFTGGAATGFMTEGEGKMAAFMKHAGPIFAGVFTIGQAFSQAKKAKEGEKVSTFFHNFLGAGVGMFLGWEVGRQLLHASGVRRLFGKFASRTMLMFFKKVTWGGFILEMASMFGVSMLFQKAFEKVSDKIFGRPSEESLGNRPSRPAPGVAGAAVGQVRQQLRPAGGGRQPQPGTGYPSGGGRAPSPAPARGNDPQLNVPIDVFRNSVAAARNQADLDRIAQQLGQSPSSSFMPSGFGT